jgi:hypothetical protein
MSLAAAAAAADENDFSVRRCSNKEVAPPHVTLGGAGGLPKNRIYTENEGVKMRC